MPSKAPDVAILGGGMAGLTAAWRLTDPDVRDRVGAVTLYQRGHRLGGKAASHRGVHGRIEEHGLHVWLGYYDNAFRLVRECYDELDRGRRDPGCPIRTWRDAFEPAPIVGLEDLHDGDWNTWTAVFPRNARVPGEPLIDETPASLADFVAQSAKLMGAFITSLGGAHADLASSVALAASAEVSRAARATESTLPFLGAIRAVADQVHDALVPSVQHHARTRRLWHLLDLISAQLRGLLADDILNRGFRSIDHLEYREWIRSHGAHEETCRGALVRGLYDLAFSHRGGDPEQTEFPAGLGLFLATKTFFDFRGALFWKMRAGMGDVVIAPLYQALRERGVRFEFFANVEELIPDPVADRIDRVEMTRQVSLRTAGGDYDPLVTFGGVPCFPDVPRVEQIDVGDDAAPGRELESFWHRPSGAEQFSLVAGRDFDELVLAIPVGMGQHIAPQLTERSRRWREMFDTLETVGTQSFQLWLRPTESELGWSQTGSTVTSFVDTYDTWSSMSHLVDVEDWPAHEAPRTIAYFCSSMPHEGEDVRDDVDQPRRAHRLARAAAVDYLDRHIGHYWPNAVDDDGRFRWELLAGADGARSDAALDLQYVTANVDPSDRYVQALPGTDHVRLAPDESGFDHLHLAGDWTDCGLNAGCIEAAVLSGIGAANSILGLPRGARISGGYLFS